MKLYESCVVVGTLALVMACGGSEPPPESAATPPPPVEAAPPPPTVADAPAAPTAPPAETAPAPAPEPPKSMSFDVTPKSGSHLTGKVTLTDAGSGVAVLIDVQGLKPGKHGAHVHETPDCSAADAKSAGSHYNPDNHPHGLPAAAAHHIGDLGNIEVGADGKGKLEITVPDANLKAGDPHSFLGRSIIIHEKVDDGGQPVGNAGGRIGCVELK